MRGVGASAVFEMDDIIPAGIRINDSMAIIHPIPTACDGYL